jgi:nucleoside 2-deoxyribosyltransferase
MSQTSGRDPQREGNTLKLYYMGSPYASPDPAIVEGRFLEAVKAVGALLKQGICTFSPIAHNHHVNIESDLAKETGESRWAFWKPFDLLMLDRCDGLIVLMIPGWDSSRGLAAEIEHAQAAGKPVFCYDPEYGIVEKLL